ncbi:MAG: alpha/beta hydrolase [Alcaligenaceae bacterium]|uniref:Alpha/beta hydrolase n=1 Tax=Paenalcaligenes hermetiae TaxID=1157987 RepID=A0ABP9LQQ6_9BURK|nr:alpha/beta hydrolase [Paenalcaligenes sp.]NLJ63115.1 alpha/beta hydrolase [Alcaligenaceae bacterium]
MFDPLLQLPIQSATPRLSRSAIPFVTQGAGDLLILIHGSLCDLRYWRWQVQKLYSSCQVVSLSLPGYWPHDPSTAAYDFTLQNHVDAVADVVSQLRQPKQNLYVLGHSRGAQVALQYALQHHELTGLILADPAFIIDAPTPALPALAQAAELLTQGQDEIALNQFIDAVSGANTWRQMVGWFKTMVEDNAHTLIAQSREALPVISAAQIDLLYDLPVLLISGELSPTRYQKSTAALVKRLAQAQHVVIDKASHGMNLANPKAFNRALLRFMQLT